MSQLRNVSTSELGYYVRVEKRVYLGIRIICPSGETCQPRNLDNMSEWRNVSTSELGYYVRVEKRVYLRIRIICPSGETCLPRN